MKILLTPKRALFVIKQIQKGIRSRYLGRSFLSSFIR